MSDLDEEDSKPWRLIRNRWFQAASALGVVLGIVGFVIGLPPVAEIAFGKRVSLSLDVVSQIPVFAVRQPVPGLSVQLNSQDLTQTKRDLVAVRLRLRNNGEISVNARNTTANDPLGFNVQGGDVVRLYGLTATSDHLRKLAKPLITDNVLTLPPGLIIDPDDYIQFDFLVVRPVSGKITFKSLGKVEGLRAISLGRPDTIRQTPNAAYVAWSGGLLSQVLRIVTYPFIAIALIALLVASGIGVSGFAARRRRKKRDAILARVALDWSYDDPKLKALVPALYAGLGMQRLSDLTDSDANSRGRDRELRRMRSVERSAEGTLSDFEAGNAIESFQRTSEASSYEAHRLLNLLALENSKTGEIAPELKGAISAYSAILEQSISSKRLKSADPESDANEGYFVGPDGLRRPVIMPD